MPFCRSSKLQPVAREDQLGFSDHCRPYPSDSHHIIKARDSVPNKPEFSMAIIESDALLTAILQSSLTTSLF
jgi:hypothetical protein